jgi:hypothetical protein
VTSLDTVRTGRVTGVRNLLTPPGVESPNAFFLAILVKESHLLVGAPKPREPRPLALSWQRRFEGDRLVEETDHAAALRSTCDVTLAGTAYNASERTWVDTRLAVGSLARTVRVHGPRRLSWERGGLTIRGAEPFVAAPLSRGHAYGGAVPPAKRRGRFGANAREHGAETELFYPRNRSGRGFGLAEESARLEGTLAPAQEDPTDPVTADRLLVHDARDWPSAPMPADYGPVDVFEYPRAQWLRPYALTEGTRPLEVLRGWVPPGKWAGNTHFDPRIASAAAPGLTGIVSAGDRCVLENLMPGGGEITFRVPRGPREASIVLPGAGRYQARVELRSLHIRPDEGQLETTWCARIPVFAPYPEADLGGMRATVE